MADRKFLQKESKLLGERIKELYQQFSNPRSNIPQEEKDKTRAFDDDCKYDYQGDCVMVDQEHKHTAVTGNEDKKAGSEDHRRKQEEHNHTAGTGNEDNTAGIGKDNTVGSGDHTRMQPTFVDVWETVEKMMRKQN